jgi:hypothetical protein
MRRLERTPSGTPRPSGQEASVVLGNFGRNTTEEPPRLGHIPADQLPREPLIKNSPSALLLQIPEGILFLREPRPASNPLDAA